MSEQEDPSSLHPSAPESAADQFAENTHSFVLRIWREETLAVDGVEMWRGHITHVPGGQRHYFQQLREVAAVITTYVPGIDGALNQPSSFSHRLRQRLCQWLHCHENQS